MRHVKSETQEIERSTFWGQVWVVGAQAGRLFRGGSDLVALKIENVVESMARTMRLHEKLTPRMINFAIRTRFLDFWLWC
jgi:hypothetical protein